MTTLKKFIRRYTSISSVIDILQRKELPLLDPQSWDDRNDRYFMSLYKEHRKIGGLYGLCAARCSETYHHWRVFTGTDDGACIEIRREPFEAALKKRDGVRFGEVEYVLIQDVGQLTTKDVKRLPFIKRVGFTAEEEYRVIAETREAQEAAISIDFRISWINRIYLNPWLPSSIAESVIKALKAQPDCANLAVQRSHLIDSSRWKKAGDIVAGKSEPRSKLQKARRGGPIKPA